MDIELLGVAFKVLYKTMKIIFLIFIVFVIIVILLISGMGCSKVYVPQYQGELDVHECVDNIFPCERFILDENLSFNLDWDSYYSDEILTPDLRFHEDRIPPSIEKITIKKSNLKVYNLTRKDEDRIKHYDLVENAIGFNFELRDDSKAPIKGSQFMRLGRLDLNIEDEDLFVLEIIFEIKTKNNTYIKTFKGDFIKGADKACSSVV